MDSMNYVLWIVHTFHKFYKKHLIGPTQVDWPVNLTYTFLYPYIFKLLWKGYILPVILVLLFWYFINLCHICLTILLPSNN